MVNEVLKFSQITGLCGKKNDLLLFSRHKLSDIRRLAIFFHGDLQVIFIWLVIYDLRSRSVQF